MTLEIAKRLQELRKAHGYSQEELAEKLCISRQAVSKWERAEANPDTDNLIALAKLYGVSLDSLLKLDNEVLELREDEYDQEEHHGGLGFLHGSVPLIIVFVYLVLGGFFGLWHPAWLLFVSIPVFDSLITCFACRRVSPFCYPVLIVVIFLWIGFKFNLWHPGWVLFLSIPIFYTIAPAIDKRSK